MTEPEITTAIEREMRAWAADCVWTEDPDDITAYPLSTILQGVDRHYIGGIAGFMADATPHWTDGSTSS